MKNRTAQLIYESIYCAFALVGTFGCIGFFNYQFFWDFYIYFTNISNFLCFGVMLAGLVQTARKKDDSFVSACPKLKFIGMLGILLTFLVFNLMLAHEPGRDPALNYRVGNYMFHVVLPVMYIADWFLFYERGKTNIKYVFISAVFPLLYVAYVYLHAACLRFNTSILDHNGDDPLIYPYFFLNPIKEGVGGVIRWILILLVAFMAVGAIFVGVDKLLVRKKDDRDNSKKIKIKTKAGQLS